MTNPTNRKNGVPGIPFALILFTLFIPSGVHAAPVIIEVQLPSNSVTALIWDRLYTDEICSLDSFPFPFPSSPRAVLDRVRFPEQPDIINNGDGASLVVRADVFLRSVNCLSHSCGTNNYFTWSEGRVIREADPLALELTYALDLTVDSSNPNRPIAELCLNLDSVLDIEGGLEVPAALLPSDLRDALDAFECPRFSLRALKKNVLGDASTITRAGISARTNGTRLGMRFEIDGPSADSNSSWNQFLGGTLAPTDPSLAWNLFIDERLLENKVRTQIDDELTCKENPRLEQCHYDFDDDGVTCDQETSDPRCDESSPFHRTSGPNATYTGGGTYGGGHLDVSVSGEIPGGFTETPCPNTLHIDPVDIDVDFRVDASDPGWMKSRIIIDPDPDDDDILECAFLLGSLPGPISSVITLIVLPIVADCYDPNPSQIGLDDSCDDITAPSCTRYCTQIHDDEHECADRIDFNDPLDVGGPTLGLLHLTQMIGRSEGALLGGAIERISRPPLFGPPAVPPFPQVAKQALIVSDGLIHEGVQGGCSSLSWGYSGSFRVRGDGELCLDMQTFNDPPAGHANAVPIFDLTWPGEDPRGPDYLGDQVANIRFPATGIPTVYQAYWANPYEFEVLVRSSAGLKYYVIPAPEPPNDAERIEALAEAFNQCNAFSFGFRLPLRAMNFLWLPDPPPFEIEFQSSYTNAPPIGETHAFLTELTVHSNNSPVAQLIPQGIPGLMFQGAQMIFEGEIEFDFGSFGKRVIPFSRTFEQTLFTTDIQADLDVVLIMSSAAPFDIKMEPQDLPPGVRSANAFFFVGPDSVLFETALLQIAGPADFNESGDVALHDWKYMFDRRTNPGSVGGRLVRTDFDRDGDTDLADLGAFQNWFTGAR